MSFEGLNKLMCKFTRLRQIKPMKCCTTEVCYDFIHPEMLWFSILLSQECLCLMRYFFLLPLIPHLSSFILTPYSPTPLAFTPDEPGQLKIYLPKKLLECLPKCSSLPKERHRWNTNEVRTRRTQEGNIRDSGDKVFAGDSSLVNVTLRDEEVANKHNGSFSLWGPKTVTPRNIKKQNKNNINLSQNPQTVHSIQGVAVYLAL